MKKKLIILTGLGLTSLIALMIYAASQVSKMLENDIFDIDDEDF